MRFLRPVKARAVTALSYSTRRLQAGDVFEGEASHVEALIRIGKAERIREPADVPAPPARVAERIRAAIKPAEPPQPQEQPLSPVLAPTPNGDERNLLRAEYLRLTGRNAFPGWTIALLREKIEAAQKTS
jgi:hypothetical protein